MPTALITGASTGIGRATALHLARSGWSVLAGVRDPAAGEALIAACAAGHPNGGAPGANPSAAAHPSAAERLTPIQLDVTDAAQIAAAAERVAQSAPGGGLDALVNNAGIGIAGPLELVAMDEWRRQFEVNVFGHIAVTQALLPALRRARGRILLLSSVGGRVVTPFGAPYCSSKYAIEAVGDSLRVELTSSGVQVALIEPGSIATPIWDKGRDELAAIEVPPELHEQYGQIPAAMARGLEKAAKRAIPPEQVAIAIERALGARRMRARYLIGREAHVVAMLGSLLPDRLIDRLLRRLLKV